MSSQISCCLCCPMESIRQHHSSCREIAAGHDAIHNLNCCSSCGGGDGLGRLGYVVCLIHRSDCTNTGADPVG
ncbi:Os04g0641450 [Oryza sativa Japonica Group]|uniref:Os04g0641450 protein n=1 Tax=Oryza sativa subsp. japonica TaxID=39947 RepID=A0A0P0WFP7_ORYSJ|nr:hypothetical protein EE612_025862 [Oryza sativa]BAS91266.1 Os04g0641450 [Oryza sativa Japonica Group]